MCVTLGQAVMTSTMVCGYVPPQNGERQRHIVSYQNRAKNQLGRSLRNCMFLNFAGSDLQLVHGPEHTMQMMSNITRMLPELREVDHYRSGASKGATVESYGDYTVVISQSPQEILEALDEEVPFNQRPMLTDQLYNMADFFAEHYPHDSFVLACFDGDVTPKHPISVSYLPREPELLTIPGLDGHDGNLPAIGAPVERNFKVAFGIHGVNLVPVKYRDKNISNEWAPESVLGFTDNRFDGLNGNYTIPVAAIRSFHQETPPQWLTSFRRSGRLLADHLVLDRL